MGVVKEVIKEKGGWGRVADDTKASVGFLRNVKRLNLGKFILR